MKNIDPQTPYPIKKWTNIAIEKIGINFIFSKLITVTVFIILVVFVFYSVAQGWPGLTIINLLDLKSLLIVLFIASTVVCLIVLALITPLIIYQNCKGYLFNTLEFPSTKVEIFEKEIWLLYIIYYYSIFEKWVKNFPIFIGYILCIILITIFFLDYRKICKETKEEFYLKNSPYAVGG